MFAHSNPLAFDFVVFLPYSTGVEEQLSSNRSGFCASGVTQSLNDCGLGKGREKPAMGSHESPLADRQS